MNDVKEVLGRLVNAVKEGDSKGAYTCLSQLVDTQPPLNNSWLGVARMALLSGEITKAREALNSFVPSSNHPIQDKLQKLAMLIEAGQIKQAFAQALELDKEQPGTPEVQHFLSTVALQLGDVKMASHYAEEVITKWPTSGQAWLILVSTKKISIKDPLVERINEVKELILGAKNHQAVSSFYAALCKVYFDLGEYEDAFKFATLANESLMNIRKYNANQDQQNASFIESQFIHEEVSKLPQLASNSESPIFIIGLPRSGTSLLEQMLCSHSSVIDGGEFNGMERAARCLTKGLPIGAHADHMDPNIVERHLPNIRESYLRYVHQKYGANGIIVDKSMTNNRYLWLIKKVFPNSPVVTIERDTLDSAWSCYRTHFSTGLDWANSQIDIAKFFSMEKKLSVLWKNKYPTSIISITYENLVDSPEENLKELCQHCGLEYEEQMLEFYKNRRPVFTASVSQVRERIHQKALGHGNLIKQKLQPFIEHYQFSNK